MKRTIKYTLATITAATLTACGGGGGGGGGSSSGPKPTGYLKAEIPQIPQSASSLALNKSSSIHAMAVDSSYNYYLVYLLKSMFVDENTADSCVGSSSNIPFVLCAIELFGVNEVGTYTGVNNDGDELSVVVSDITGDVNGYELKVVITNNTKNAIVFKYKASGDGKKGIIEGKPDLIIGGNPNASLSPNGFSLTWDSGVATAQTLTYQFQSYIQSEGVTAGGSQATIVKAIVNETAGTADVVSFDITANGDPGNVGNVIPKAQISHARTNSSKEIYTVAKCTDSSTSGINATNCLTVNNTNFPMSTSDYKCGVFDMQAPGLDVTEAGTLSGSYGSYSAGSFTNSACSSLSTGYSVRIDKSSSDSSAIGDIVQSIRTVNWTTLNLYGKASWLDAN